MIRFLNRNKKLNLKQENNLNLNNYRPPFEFDLQRFGGTPVTGVGEYWDLPNYVGMLFSADPTMTPFLSMIGGLTGGKTTANWQFPTSSEYDFTAAAQPAITETQSLTASTYLKNYVRDQSTNVTQIFMKAVHASYVKLSNQGRLSGLNTQGAVNNVDDEMVFQKATAIKELARDVEYTFLNGVYVLTANQTTASKTRGILAAIVVGALTVAAATADISKALIDELLRTMAAGGAVFDNMVLFCNAFQMQSISDIYGYAPMDRNVGGVAIKQILTDFTTIGIVYDPFIPTDDIALVDVAHCAPVFQPVPEKGNLFYEELARTGAAISGQIFGQIGLDYGSVYMHGSITNLSTS